MAHHSKKPEQQTVFHDLHGTKKLQYIWDYYKLPLAVCCILLYILCHLLYGRLTHKETALYVALVNVNAGSELSQELTEGYLSYAGLSPAKNQVYLYQNLYLSASASADAHGYVAASRMKLLSAIDAERLDIVLMNKEAYDAFSEAGYLRDLDIPKPRRLDNFGLDGELYLGVIANSPRPDAAADYLTYLSYQ